MLPRAERFNLIKELGRGGFAVTYLAEVIDPELIEDYETNKVAIKVPISAETERALKKEMELAAGLKMLLADVKTSNIVKYLGIEIFNNQPVMVMEFISGGSLRNLLGGMRKRLCIEPKRAIKIALGILAGISAMHTRHIIHRDIKPENILMDGDTPKIADLGISRLLLENQLAETLAGTNFYISPELVLERKASFGTDIWSFGVTFYEMLFGCFPYNMENITYKELTTNRDLKLLFADHVGLAENIKNILIKCLKVNPDERYKNADEIIKDLNLQSKTEEEAPEDQLFQIQELLHDPVGYITGEEKLKNLLKQYPKSSKTCLVLGEFYNKTGNYHKAIDIFVKGLESNPENAKIHWALAMSHQKTGNNHAAVCSLQKAFDIGLDKSLERYGKILLQNLKQKNGA